MKHKWWKESVVYQIYPRSFFDSNGDGVGDLPGVLAKLDYIQDLGADVIWLNPIYRSPDDDNGYDIADYQMIDPRYGSLGDFRQLLQEIHKRRMRLIMDLVLHHTSDEHEWFQRSKSSRTDKYRDYYIWRDPKNGKEPNNWGNYFYEGSAWEYDRATGQYYLHHYSKKMPDLNWQCPALRKDMYAMLRWWLDIGIDGFRLDAINRLIPPEGFPDSWRPPTPPVGVRGYVVDREMCANQPGIHELLREMNREVFSHYDIMLVGETSNVDPQIALPYVKEENRELNMLFHFQIARTPERPSVAKFKDLQARWYDVVRQNGWITQFLSNHDTARQVSWFGDDREYRIESATLLATLLHTLPGTPFIYQGEEIGMTNVEFPSIEQYREKYTLGKYQTMIEAGVRPAEALRRLRAISRDNARTPMQWSGSPNAGFTQGKPWLPLNPNFPTINVELDRNSARSVGRYYGQLIRLRRANPVMVYGSFQPILEAHSKIIAYLREYESTRWLVVANYSDGDCSADLPNDLRGSVSRVVLSNYSDDTLPESSRLNLRPFEAKVFSLHSGAIHPSTTA